MDVDEYRRWLDMAERTVKSAVRDAEGGDYNWACFKAHQAAEFALKALLYGIGRPVRSHSATRLLREISAFAEVGEELFELAALLDKFYVPTRYVDAWSEGVPYEYFTRRDAESALKAAEKILEFVKETWRRLSGGRG